MQSLTPETCVVYQSGSEDDKTAQAKDGKTARPSKAQLPKLEISKVVMERDRAVCRTKNVDRNYRKRLA